MIRTFPWISDAIVLHAGVALVHFIWQGTLIAAMAAIVLRLLRDDAGRDGSATARPSAGEQPSSHANARYMTACFGQCLMAVMPALTLVMMAPLAPTLTSQDSAALPIEDASAEERESGTNATHSVVASEPMPDSATLSSQEPGLLAERRTLNGDPMVVKETRSLRSFLLCVAFWSWICGVVLLSMRHIIGWSLSQRLRRHGAAVSEEVRDLVAKLARRLRINRIVDARQTIQAAVPMMIGWIKPVLILPVNVLTGLTPTELEAVIAHELAHVKRHDYLVNLLQVVVETLLFYHPAVWWLSRRICLEREFCADDLAIRICPQRDNYAHTLASLAEIARTKPVYSVAATGGRLTCRIRRVLGMPDAYPTEVSRTTHSSLAAILVLVSIGAAAGLIQVQAGHEPLTADASEPHSAGATSNKKSIPAMVDGDSPRSSGEEQTTVRFPQAGTRRSSAAISDASAICFHSGNHVHFVLCYLGFLQQAFQYDEYGETPHASIRWRFRGHVNGLSGKRTIEAGKPRWEREQRFALTFDYDPPGLALTIEGEEYDLANGRVFVLGTDGRVTQVDVAPLAMKYFGELERVKEFVVSAVEMSRQNGDRQDAAQRPFDDGLPNEETPNASAATEAAARLPGARRTLTVNGVPFHFRWCPPGEFEMGWPEDLVARWDEDYLDFIGNDVRHEFVRPHRVTLTRGSWMQETEVTRSQYFAVMGKDPSHWAQGGNSAIGGRHPVHSVSWVDACRFCEKMTTLLGGSHRVSLPTEAQWEYACRAGTQQLRFANLDETAWHTENTTNGEASTGPRPVASKAPNPWSIYDMLGNMEEWCADWHGPYPAAAVVDPAGPDRGEKRVVRGRSHEDSGQLKDPMDMRYGFHAADRYGKRPDARDDLKQYVFKTVGFRVVLSAASVSRRPEGQERTTDEVRATGHSPKNAQQTDSTDETAEERETGNTDAE